MPIVAEVHNEVVYNLILEAQTLGLYSYEESKEAAELTREDMSFREYILQKVYAHQEL